MDTFSCVVILICVLCELAALDIWIEFPPELEMLILFELDAFEMLILELDELEMLMEALDVICGAVLEIFIKIL